VASLSNMDAKVDPESACEVAFYLGTFYLEKCDRNEAQAPRRGGCQRLSAKSHRVGSGKGGIDAASVDSLTEDGCRRYERPNPAPTSDDHELGKCLITRRGANRGFQRTWPNSSRPPTADGTLSASDVRGISGAEPNRRVARPTHRRRSPTRASEGTASCGWVTRVRNALDWSPPVLGLALRKKQPRGSPCRRLKKEIRNIRSRR
jgi:hypothetical protein